MRKYFFVISLVAFNATAFSQKYSTTLSNRIDSLKVIGKNIIGGKTDSARIASNEEFLLLMEETLDDPASFEASFDSVKNISRLHSPDNSFNIYTWTLPKTDMSAYSFFGFVQYYDTKKKLKVVRLNDASATIENPQSMKLKSEDWFGAVYYDIDENKKGGKKYYTLLGWKGNNQVTTKKLIDVMYFKKDSVMFGYPLFKSEKGYVNRVVFEYAAEAVMSLRYEHSKKIIVFDNLSGTSDNTAGPNGKYDAYGFVKGHWEFIKDVDVSKFSNR